MMERFCGRWNIHSEKAHAMTHTSLSGRRMLSLCGFFVILAGVMTRVNHIVLAAKEFDVVIAGGRVMDPESGLDGIRDVGITGGKIVAISSEHLQGKATIDAKGLVVAPGFTALHEHGQEPRNYQFQAHDGVTTSLELEVGTDDIDKWYADRESKSLSTLEGGASHIKSS